MTRGIVIVGNEAPLTLALSQEAARRLETHGLALIPAETAGTPLQFPPPPATIPLTWSPSSPISARTLLVAAENRLSRIDEALLVCTPLALRARPDQLDPALITQLIDDHLKGWYYLVREFCRYFRERKAGTLAMVLAENPLSGEREETPDLLGSALGAAYRSFMQSVLASAPGAAYRLVGFTGNDPSQDGDFAAFIFKVLDEDNRRENGKLHRFGKLGIFR
ncbi:MAG: hypothetical protein LDL24_05415 [Treponema sp.]|nr:hypothetical protein [Treponema sp.]